MFKKLIKTRPTFALKKGNTLVSWVLTYEVMCIGNLFTKEEFRHL